MLARCNSLWDSHKSLSCLVSCPQAPAAQPQESTLPEDPLETRIDPADGVARTLPEILSKYGILERNDVLAYWNKMQAAQQTICCQSCYLRELPTPVIRTTARSMLASVGKVYHLRRDHLGFCGLSPNGGHGSTEENELVNLSTAFLGFGMVWGLVF